MVAPEITVQFDQLQRRLVPLWRLIGQSAPGGPIQDENTIVVVPSMSIDREFTSAAQQAYEERFLFMLFLLRQPQIRLIYVTSQIILPSIVDYYLNVMPGVIVSNARKRLFLVSPLDGSPSSLTRKLLDRPRLIASMQSLIPDLHRAHLVPYNTTDLERELAVRLGIPMYAADPRFFGFGTKSGSRRIFAEEQVLHPLGMEDLARDEDAFHAIAAMRSQKPTLRRVLVKLNEGVSGEGNALVDLDGLPPSEDPSALTALAERFRAMRFELPGMSFEAYIAKFNARGGIVEELISGDEVYSPSVQLRISPLGEVELLSTHDQLLGGPGGQSYLGARFPASPAYGPLIVREAAKVGARLAREGVIGRFALDFVVARSGSDAWRPFAIEINLRKGGTTSPFLTLQYLTDGSYDAQNGVFRTPRGHPKYYVAADVLESPHYRVFTPDDVFDLVSGHRLHFDHVSQTGVVLHMVSAIGDMGRLGLTAIADSPDDAQALYDRTSTLLDTEARAAAQLDRRSTG